MAGYRDMIVHFLQSKGLNQAAIAGILGNWMVESNFSPSALNGHEGAIGFAQWEGGRRDALRNWALTHHGADETDAQSQLEFFWHELTTSYSHVLDQLRHVQTPAEAAAIFDSQYEVSSGSTRQQRIDYAHQFYTGSGPNPDYAGPTGGGATGDAGTGGGGHMKASDYAGVQGLGNLLDSVPELRKLVDEAVANNWSPDQFQNQVEDSHWWKQHSDSARSTIILQANDPATYSQNLTHVRNSISALSHQLGMPLTSAQLSAIATSAMLSGNDTNQQWLTQQISKRENYSHLTNDASLTGGMAATVQQLNQLGADYGYKWSPAQQAQHAQAILSGQTTIDTYKQNLITWAKSAFPGLAEQIDNGMTVKQLADPYISSMSQLLEIDPGSLDVWTPAIRKAMQGYVDPKTKVRAPQSLSDFEDQVRTDPRWQYTQNAKDTMSTALLKVGADFGFGPQG